jgi:murein DD-endopeptidase MepM/ murein hydrolase activator NlpD
MFYKAILLILWLVFISSPLLNAEVNKYVSRLKLVKADYDIAQRRLISLRTAQLTTWLGAVREERAISDLQTGSTKILEQLAGNYARISLLEERLKETKERVNQLQELFEKRVKSFYLSQAYSSQFDDFLLLNRFKDTLKGGYFLSKIRRSDQLLRDRLVTLRRTHSRQREELGQATQHQLALLSDLLAKELSSRMHALNLITTRAQLTAEEGKVKDSLNQLKHQIERIEKVISEVTQKSAVKIVRTKEFPSSERPEGLPKQILLPVEGAIIRRFGRSRVGSFKEEVFFKGVELQATGIDLVRNIAAGVALFVGELPGYGLVVIVDHGNRDFSLYGRLTRSIVSIGSNLIRGQPVGQINLEVGASDQNGAGNFYFEIRRQGKPVDPLSLVKGRD